MSTIVFNNEEGIELESFNKNTSFEGESMNSTGYVSLIKPDIDALFAIAQETITSIKIIHEGEEIYNSSNLNCRITSINEYFSDDRVSINMNFIFR